MRPIGIPHAKPRTKFEVTSSSSFKDMFDRMPKIVGSRDLGHAHFQEKLFVRLLGIAHTKRHTKFEVFSSSSFGAIDAAMVGVTLNDLLTKVKVIHFGTNYQSISHIRLPIVTFALGRTV